MKTPVEKPVAGIVLLVVGALMVLVAFSVWRAGINVLQGEILYDIGAGALLIAGAFMMGLSAVLFSLTEIANRLAQIAANGEPEKKTAAAPKTTDAPLRSPPKEPSVYKL
jgi:hypothetical protein